MSKIILNPEAGAPISNVMISGKKYFGEKPFEVDSMIKLEDDSVADDLLKLFGFLVEFSPEEAKKYKEDQERRTFKCTKCTLKTTTQLALDNHLNKHLKDEALEKELGIEVIGIATQAPQVDGQTAIDIQARNDGLDYGDGLVDDSNKIGAKF